MKNEQIIEIYESKYGKIEEMVRMGYRITFNQNAKGNWVVTKYYEPNSYKSEKGLQVVYNKEGMEINKTY